MDTNDISNIVNSGNTLINALEKFFPYWGLEGKALNVYIDEISKSDKPKEVKMIEILNAKQSIRRIKNVKSIMEIASSFTKEEKINQTSYSDNEEWFDNFFEKASYISDKDIQVIWGKILSNEIENKGSTPKGIFRILSEIDASSAKAFAKLCEQKLVFVLLDDNNHLMYLINEPIIFDSENDYYVKKGLSLSVINELESLGLVSTTVGLQKKLSSKVSKILISDGHSTECMLYQNKEHLNFGNLMFTKTGNYLSKLIDAGYADDQISVMKKYYIKYHYIFDENNKWYVSINHNSINICKINQ